MDLITGSQWDFNMGDKLIIGPINRGLRTDRKPFVIDNDSFPTLVNAYQWRGRIKRKRGTSLLNRLQRNISETDTLSSGATTLAEAPVVPGTFSFTDTTTSYLYTDLNGNLFVTTPITGATQATNCVLTANNNFSNGDSVFITGVVGMTQLNNNTYTIVSRTSTHITLNVNSTGFTSYSSAGTVKDTTKILGTINYATGAVTIVGGGSDQISGTYSYYPCLPVMGLEDFILSTQSYPQTLGFDTTYSYNISTSAPFNVTDITFYKNPPLTTAYPSYTPKGSATPFTWNGQNYQQFWTANYQNSLWTTNGITVPFTTTNIGMQFLPAASITSATQTTATTVVFVIPSTPLIVGDFVFANEFTGTSGSTINGQTGYVTVVSGTSYTVKFPNATIGGAGLTPGILQYLTNSSSSTTDCLRWYDGTGWVNFCPPLSELNYTIEDSPQAIYYLVGARVIVPFKDRLLFFGPVIQPSTGSATPIYLQDCVIYSQNGTPYYTASFTGVPLNTATVFYPILTPNIQGTNLETATPTAYWEDQIGFGGNQPAGIDQAITTVSPNEDALIVGFNNSLQTRFIYTGNDIVPFAFFIINAELGSGSTFSAVTTDDGVITKGPRGFIITSQTTCSRIDLDILDKVFEISNISNGAERFCSQRDFINEWIYFTYPVNNVGWVFPTQSLQFNYRDNSWAIFNESYTTYGQFRIKTGYTWGTIGQRYPTWGSWNVPWNSGSSSLLQPKVIAGNAQGFVIMRDEGTAEATSLYISGISSNVITSPNHCLNTGDYITITGCLGTIGPIVNNNIYSVRTIDANTFALNPVIGTGTYLGGGLITRLYIPQIYSKQFPTAWDMGRKTRIGVQQYLFTRTPQGQITLLLFVNQNSSPSNNTTIVPDPSSNNDGLVYSTILYTCPESTNLGLTPANTNLQQATSLSNTGIASNNQQQIWHRLNTSLIGDTVQFGITLSDAQMRDTNFYNQFTEIEFHAAILDLYPSQMLS
jgi:hypothetical protein